MNHLQRLVEIVRSDVPSRSKWKILVVHSIPGIMSSASMDLLGFSGRTDFRDFQGILFSGEIS